MPRQSNPVKLAVQSARCAARLRRHRVSSGLVTCEGRLPILRSGGDIALGRLSLRAPTTPMEIGAQAGAKLTIGDRVFINQGAVIVAALEITIAEDCRIGDFVAIYDTDYHPLEQGVPVTRSPVRLGRNVWLARGSIVLPGVEIGDHAVIAAGAVVTADVPARTLMAGNPARPVRSLSADERWRRT